MVPDGGSTQPAPVTRGFLFADLRGYTAFTEKHGDKVARDLLDAYRQVVRKVVREFGGAEIKTEGDSFYVVFPSATAAVKCGVALVEAANRATRDRPDLPITVGVGIHAGETAESEEGYVGSAVNVAARLGAAAGAGEVLVSETVRGLTRTGGEVRYVSIGNRRFKGISEPIAVFAASDATAGSVGSGSRRPRVAAAWRGGGAVAAVVAGILLLGALLLSEGFNGMLPTANASPTSTAQVTPSTPPEPSGPPASSPAISASPVQAGIAELQLGKADPGRYRAGYFDLRPEFELAEGWAIGNCPSNGPVHCENVRNNGYDPGLIKFKLSERPQSQLVLFHPSAVFDDPCAFEARPTASPTEPFLGWLRAQPGLEIGAGIARDFAHVKTTLMDVKVVDELACTTTTPPSVVLRGFGTAGGGTFFSLDRGTAIKLYAVNVPSGVFAFVIAPNEDELQRLLPKAEEVLDSLEFPNR
jgi:class 3 adenylate cyclase